jgi:hypothetical protein
MRTTGNTVLRKAAMIALATASFSLVAEQAAASEWKDDAATWWVIRTKHMAEVTTKGLNGGAQDKSDKIANGDTLRANMLEACDGLQGEQQSHEYGKMPRWALGAQLDVCSAMERWGGRGFMTSKSPARPWSAGSARSTGSSRASIRPRWSKPPPR